MRRLDLHPKKKLRNPARHLRQLARWPERIVAELPGEAQLKERRYWNFKAPVFSKLIEPPHATPDTQRACIASLFAAAEAVEHSPRRPRDCRVACLVTTPFLFQSEVTLFADEDYYRSFLPVDGLKRTEFEGGWVEAAPVDAASLTPILPSAPEGLAFQGGTLLREFDPEWGDAPVERINWVWSYPRH